MMTGPDREWYRVALIDPRTRLILVNRDKEGPKFPRISLPRWARSAQHFQDQVRDSFSLDAVVLDCLEGEAAREPLLVAEVLERESVRASPSQGSWSDLPAQALGTEETRILESLLSAGTTGRGFCSRFGWFEEVLAWVRAEAGLPQHLSLDVTQLNATSDSTLLRIATGSGTILWFKCVSAARSAEFAITTYLCKALPKYLPRIIAERADWGGWLMTDAGSAFEESTDTTVEVLRALGQSLASLHIDSQPMTADLLEHIHDLRPPALLGAMSTIEEALELAVTMPDHDRKVAVTPTRLREAFVALRSAIYEIAELDLPNTLVHNDLNLSNILVCRNRCTFTDWAEAGIGNPIANFEQLRMQVAQDSQTHSMCYRLTGSYCGVWLRRKRSSRFQRSLALAPLIALSMYMHRQRDWLTPESMANRQMVRYARSMASQIERAASLLDSRPALIA